jgi:hypothetical protein
MATLDVLRYSGDLKIATVAGGTMTLDTGVSSGTVVITGNLNVLGTQTNVSTTNTNIKDNIIILNSGETNGYVTLNNAGFVIDRGNKASSTSSAQFIYSDNLYYSTTATSTSTYRGFWGIYTGNRASALALHQVRLSPLAPNDSLGRRALSLLGQGTSAVLSVAGQTDYKSRVTDKDDIPNKDYLDFRLSTATITTATNALGLRQGNTYITIDDDSITGQPSKVTTFIDDVPTFLVQGSSIVMSGIAVVGQTIRPTTNNTNLTLQTQGTGTVVVNNGISIGVSASAPQAAQGVVKVYSTTTIGAGSTGLLFKTLDINASPVVTVQGELISARKALVFSIIF